MRKSQNLYDKLKLEIENKFYSFKISPSKRIELLEKLNKKYPKV